jgi:hypothetical protein
MERGVIVRGRLHGRHIDLDESVDELEGEVIRSLPPGSRTKEDIDRQITDERDSWGDR